MTVATPVSAWRQMTGRVVRQHSDHGDGHWWLELELPDLVTAPVPGQFMQLQPPGLFLPRPMSVAGTDGRRVSFLYAPVGAGTRALAGLRAGDTVETLGPLGRGFPLDAPGNPVLIAGGRGVAPLLFAADALDRRPEFLFGARSAEQLVGLPEASRRLAHVHGGLHVCTDDGSHGDRGNVVQLLDRLAPGFPRPIVIHACGPHGMLAAIARWALARDVRAWLAMESVMACGTGVCRGCPLPRSAAGAAQWTPALPSLHGNREYAMCCTEGPVFEARELDWERVS